MKVRKVSQGSSNAPTSRNLLYLTIKCDTNSIEKINIPL